MQVAEVKTSSTARNKIQAKRQPFFSKEGQDSFFSNSNETTTSFFSPTIQSKPASSAGGLTIGQPDDKYEVEADAMADKVVQRLSSNKVTLEQSENSTMNVVQPKCDTCEKDEEEIQNKEDEIQKVEEQVPEVQEKSIFESDTEEAVQTKPEGSISSESSIKVNAVQSDNIYSNPVIQAKCQACEEEEIEEHREEQELQRKESTVAAGDPLEEEDPNVQLRSLEMEKTEYPILFKKIPNLQFSSRGGSGSGTREQIVDEAQQMVGKIEAKKDDGSSRRMGAKHLLEIFHLAADDAWSDEVIENVRYKEEFPHWCGIFSVYAIKKAGIDLGFWQVGMGVSSYGTLEPTDNPQPGDIGYFTKFQHHCIIKAVNGDMIDSIDGNSGNFSEVIERTRPKSDFHAFFTAYTGSEKKIQKKAEVSTPINGSTSNLQDKLNTRTGKGAPLDKGTRSEMESGFGVDFSNVNIHTDSTAVHMNKDLNAQAFTHGSDIYFNQGKYDTSSSSGKHLLAHELTHTMQQGAVPNLAPKIQKNGNNRSESDEHPFRSGISVGMTGIMILPVDGATFKAGSKLDQAFHILVFRLIGSDYFKSYADQLLSVARTLISGIGMLTGNATEGEEIPEFFVPIKILDGLIGRLRTDQYEVLLSQSQLDILRFGVFANIAWTDYHIPEVASDIGVTLPKWYSQHLFIQEISHHIGLLRIYIDELQIYREEPNPANKQAVVDALAGIIYTIEGEAALLEVIRSDQELVAHSIYQTLWPSANTANPDEQSTEETPEPQMAAEDRRPNAQVATSFFAFSRTQPDLSRNSFTQPEDRKELLDRFERFLVRGVSAATGDQQLSEEPGTANSSPHNSRMNISPALSGPPGGLQLEASEAADYRFIMSILFPSVFDAFQRYYFEWNYVRVPDEQLGRPVDYEDLEQQDPSTWDVAANRFTRAGSYAVEDVDTLFESLGPFGIGAVSLVAANAILRFIGTGIRLGFEILTMPDSEKLIQFPGPGVYMVRCKAIPDYNENAELVRPPSVAFQPLIVKDPLEMIRSRVDQQVVVNEANFERMRELREMLAEPVSYENEDELRKELEILEQSLSSVGGSLEVQKQQLEQLINDPKTREPERKRAQKQLENIIKIIQLRKDRSEDHDLTGAEPLIASFVSDTGQSIRLSLEAVNKFGENTQEYWISDLTTANSSQATGYGADRKSAILDAIEKILEGTGGYGRGFVAVSIDGVTYNRRIASSLGNLFMEAVENVTTVLSLAAVVAAPFTGGASLALLLPIGVVGAVPSAYRLINRSIDNTLRFDMATAMDIVNIAGGLVGLGHATVPLRMIQTGRILYVMGLGIDGLGVLMIPVGVICQIMELEGLPPGERAARIMEILGQAMLNAGIMAGGIIADRARQRGFETNRSRTTDGTDAIPSRNIELEDLPQGRRELADVKSGIVEINGNRHQVSVSFQDGNLYIRICSDCGPLIQRMYHMLQDASIPTDLKTSIRELLNKAEGVQADINLGRRDTESSEVQHDIDQIAQDLVDMAGNYPSHTDTIVNPVGGTTLTTMAIDQFRARIQELGRSEGNHAEATTALETMDNEILPSNNWTDAEKMMMIGSLIEGLRTRMAPTRDQNMQPVDMTDSAMRSLFEEVIARPEVESVPAWQYYMAVVKSRYFGKATLYVGRSPRSTDAANVSTTNPMRAAFIDGMSTGTVLPEASVAVRRHLNRAIEEAGSAQGAVDAGDAVWIDSQRGNRTDATNPNATLWPADPMWGVWRVDHIVELQHGGADMPFNYFPAPQRMHGIKSEAMNSFGRRARESGLVLE